jgi:hypothetical protein
MSSQYFKEPPASIRKELYRSLRCLFDIDKPKEIIVINQDMYDQFLDYNNKEINVCERLVHSTMRSRNALYYNTVDGFKFHVINRRHKNLLSVVKLKLPRDTVSTFDTNDLELYFGITYVDGEIHMDTLISPTRFDITSINQNAEILHGIAAFMLNAIFCHEMISYPD